MARSLSNGLKLGALGGQTEIIYSKEALDCFQRGKVQDDTRICNVRGATLNVPNDRPDIAVKEIQKEMDRQDAIEKLKAAPKAPAPFVPFTPVIMAPA